MHTTPASSIGPVDQRLAPKSTKIPFSNGFLVKFFKNGTESFFFTDKHFTKRQSWNLPKQKGSLPNKKEYYLFVTKNDTKEIPLTCDEVVVAGRLLHGNPVANNPVTKPARKNSFVKKGHSNYHFAEKIYFDSMGVKFGTEAERITGPDKVPTRMFFTAGENILTMSRNRLAV